MRRRCPRCEKQHGHYPHQQRSPSRASVGSKDSCLLFVERHAHHRVAFGCARQQPGGAGLRPEQQHLLEALPPSEGASAAAAADASGSSSTSSATAASAGRVGVRTARAGA